MRFTFRSPPIANVPAAAALTVMLLSPVPLFSMRSLGCSLHEKFSASLAQRYTSFSVNPLTHAERQALGRHARKQVARRAHADFKLDTCPPDPLVILADSMRG